MDLDKALSLLQSPVQYEPLQDQFLAYLRKMDWRGLDRETTYEAVLRLLSVNSSVGVKQFMYEVAWWYYSNSKNRGMLSFKEQQAIRRDLLLYSKPSRHDQGRGQSEEFFS
jgi:hypothetical protein